VRKQIPVRTEHWDVSMPGFIEADTVAHCGESMAGEFCWSLTATDVHTQWTETRAVFNRGQHAVAKRIAEIEAALPFAILGFDTDNGGEFLNWHLLNYFARRRHPVGFTRSRAHRKNDNARVEQKNWTHVRQLVGYGRLENPQAAELLNELYAKEWGWFRNFFCPVMKHLRTEAEGSRKRRIYDAPATPFERFKACESRSQPWKISIALWILSRSKKPSRPGCAPCCVTKFGCPFSKRPERARTRLAQTGSSGLAPAPRTLSLWGSGCRYLASRHAMKISMSYHRASTLGTVRCIQKSARSALTTNQSAQSALANAEGAGEQWRVPAHTHIGERRAEGAQGKFSKCSLFFLM
jgi:hypothetical protein